MNKLVIDHQTGTYTVSKNGVQHSAPIRHSRTVKHIAGYFKHIGYSVYIIHRKGNTPPMPLSPSQQAIVDRNHWRALYAVKHGSKKVNGQTLKAMVNRNFINYKLEILPAGESFYEAYNPDPEDLELEEQAQPPTPETVETSAATEILVTDTAITPAARTTPIPTETQPVIDQRAATDEARETILALRHAALCLGKALVRDRVPELAELFAAIERSDTYLFK